MKRVRLGDIATVITKGTTPTTLGYNFVDDGVNFVKIESITENGEFLTDKFAHITDECDRKLSRSQLQRNDLLFSIAGAIGRTAIVTEDILPANTNQALAIIRVPEGVVDYSYLKYVLQSPDVVEQFEKKKQGVAQLNISLKDIGDFVIPLRTTEEQKTVVDTMDKVTELIALRKEQLAKLDQLVKSGFIELFGDPNLNDKGWLMGVINDIGACVAGATPGTQVKEYWENGTIPWMSSGEVNKGRVFETDTKITQLGYDNASTKLVPPKTVVLAMAGQGRTRGTAAITEIELCTNQSICSIVNNEKVHAEYLLYFLKLQYMELRGASTNTDGRGGLNLKIIGNYPIMIPPMALQEQFAAFVEQTDKLKLAIQQSLDKLELLKKSLMQEYFG